MKVGDFVWNRRTYRRGSYWERREIIAESTRSWKVRAYWSERMKDDIINLPKNTEKWDEDWAVDEADARRKELAIQQKRWRGEVLDRHFDFGIFCHQAKRNEDLFEKVLKIAEVMGWNLPNKPEMSDISLTTEVPS